MFEDFRRLSLREYELAPENFFTLPGLSLSAALKLTGANLQLITDPNLYLWFESMIRGGICFVAHRESRSNLEHMSSYEPDKKRVLTSYFDANNLCEYHPRSSSTFMSIIKFAFSFTCSPTNLSFHSFCRWLCHVPILTL